MAEPPLPAAEPPRRLLAFDMPCVGCGYNLRSLNVDGVCPECGRPIRESFAHGWLAFADPAWITMVRRGVLIALWSLLAAVVLYVLLILAFVVIESAGLLGSFLPSFPGGIILAVLAGWTATGAYLACAAHLTWPETRLGGSRAPSRTPLARAALVLIILFFPLILLLGLLITEQVDAEELRRGLFAAIVVTVVATMACQAGSLLLLMVHLRRIARRDPRRGLTRMMTFLIWGQAGLLGWAVGFNLLMLFTMPGAVPPPIPAAQASAPAVVTPAVGPVTTQPLTPATMPATRVGPPFGGLGFAAFIAVVLIGELFALAWCVCGVIALFWFLRIFRRAIEHHVDLKPLGWAG